MKNQNLIIKKSNDLITAKYRLTVIQQYILHNVIAKIHVNDTDFKKYRIDVREIADAHAISTKNAYNYIKKSALQLNRQPIVIGDEEEGIVLNWFTSVRYNTRQGSLLVDFHPDLKPYLLQLQSYFTQYEHRHIQQFKCAHSLRFYELLKQKQNLGRGKKFYIELEIAELRTMFSFAEDEYKRISDLKRFVIAPALKEIDEQTDLKILNIDYLKLGRTITSITIHAELKQGVKKTTAKPKGAEESKQSPAEPEAPIQLPQNFIKQPQQLLKDSLEHRVSKIVGLIQGNQLLGQFSQEGEKALQTLTRIKSEITTHDTAEFWESKLEELGIPIDGEREKL